MKISTTLAIALAGSMLAACGAPAGRTGSGIDPVSLTTYQGTPEGLLGRLANVSSETAVTIKQVPAPPLDGTEDTATLTALAAGDVDLALLRAGRLTEEGAVSLAPLGAPFVVTNNDQAIAIARDAVTDDLFASLPDLGLVGLALVPVGVRHPFGYGPPLLGASDYAGQTINARVDAGVREILEALGATPDDSAARERTDKVLGGQLRGIETSLQVLGAVDRPAVMTSNVNLYERFDVVLVREPAWDALTAAQQEELTRSVTTARDEAYASMPTEEALFDEWCILAGAGSALASSEQLASLHEKLDPITAEVASQQGPVLDRLRLLHQGTTDAGDLTCPVQAALPAWTTMKPRGDQGVLDGTWRFADEEDELLADGLTPSDAYGNAGVWEMSIDHGVADATLPDGRHCDWSFTFDGDRVVFDLGPQDWCQGLMVGTYRVRDDTVDFDWTDTSWPATEAAYGLTFCNAMFGEAVRVH